MVQNDVQTNANPRGIRYHMVFPPAWREFGTSHEFEKALVTIATAEAKQAGRADIVLTLRQNIHVMFEELRRTGSLSVVLPVKRLREGAIPASLIVTPLKVGSTGTLAEAVSRVSGSNLVEAQPVDGTNWYLWHTDSRSDEAQDLRTLGINMVVPRPRPDGTIDQDPKAGLWLRYSYLEITGSTPEEMNEGLLQLGYAIIGSFKWVPVQ